MLREIKKLRAENRKLREDLARISLTISEHPTQIHGVTQAQIDRRGRAIARAKAGTDRLLLAIVKSQWKTQGRYATERLGVTAASLSAYRKGITPTPRGVADAAKADFGIGDAYWPKIVE